MSLIVLYFLHSNSVLSFYIDIVLTFSILKVTGLIYTPCHDGIMDVHVRYKCIHTAILNDFIRHLSLKKQWYRTIQFMYEALPWRMRLKCCQSVCCFCFRNLASLSLSLCLIPPLPIFTSLYRHVSVYMYQHYNISTISKPGARRDDDEILDWGVGITKRISVYIVHHLATDDLISLTVEFLL